ncbi:unnamed protein product [Lactuca saligna]|uniref:Reverse transcriptase zinc-binding domain-containing protein n=1 Tax=Lactuca saligna TaxID=75948 RepID=A0AA35YW01_LACSI|nr:unnamed protein product [Lactuca saligna]
MKDEHDGVEDDVDNSDSPEDEENSEFDEDAILATWEIQNVQNVDLEDGEIVDKTMLDDVVRRSSSPAPTVEHTADFNGDALMAEGESAPIINTGASPKRNIESNSNMAKKDSTRSGEPNLNTLARPISDIPLPRGDEWIVSPGFCWSWKSQIIEDEVMGDLTNLCEMLRGVNTQPTQNGFRFNLSVDGLYTMAAMKRIPVAENLEARGVKVQSSMCSLCNMVHEYSDHLLIKCDVAVEARNRILNWCGIPNTQFNDVNEFLNFAATWGNCPRKRVKVTLMLYGLLWFIWIARNNKRFKGIHTNPAKIADEVILQTFSWFKFISKEELFDRNTVYSYNQMASTACFMIISRNDIPIYDAEVGSAPKKEEAAHQHQFILHAALDVVQDLAWTTSAMFLKSVDRFNDLVVSVYVTAGHILFIFLLHTRLMLLHDSRNDDGIKTFFQEVHELYIKILLNPLYLPGSRVTSSHFDTKVRALARRYL